MKRFLLLTALAWVVDSSFAQPDYREGYVITSAQDTLYGLIDYPAKSKANSICNFKNSKGENSVTYKPTDLFGYHIKDDKFFLSRQVNIKNQSPTIAFLEVIIGGHVSLFRYGDIYFVEKANDDLQQLLNESKEVSVNGKSAIQNSNQHISILNMLLGDCPEIREDIQNIKLNEKSLTSLIKEYNKCRGWLSITYKAKKPWTKEIFGIAAGANISRLLNVPGESQPSATPVFGVSFCLLSPRINERLSFNLDLFYLTPSYYIYNKTDYTITTIRDYVTIDLSQLKVPISFRYTFPKRLITPYFMAGMYGTFNLKSNSEWVQEVESVSQVITVENSPIGIKKFYPGLWGGCGIIKSMTKKLDAFVEIKYERSSWISDEFTLKETSIQLAIGIRTN